jgi:hypothetical protein
MELIRAYYQSGEKDKITITLNLMPGGYKLSLVKEGRAPAIYRRSGHVPAGHVPPPISPLHYSTFFSNVLLSCT